MIGLDKYQCFQQVDMVTLTKLRDVKRTLREADDESLSAARKESVALAQYEAGILVESANPFPTFFRIQSHIPDIPTVKVIHNLMRS